MDNDVIERLRTEEADLSRKLRAVRDLLAAYGEDVGTPNYAVPSVTFSKASAAPVSSSNRGKVGIDGFGSYGRQIVASSIMVMQLNPFPVKTRKIVEVLEQMGIQITGENKVNAVGALLSRSADVVSHGKRGWTVADENVARDIVGKYAHSENEASRELADASDAADEGAPPPEPALSNSNPWPGA